MAVVITCWLLLNISAAYISPPIPTPPDTINAPVSVDVLDVVFVIDTTLVVVLPLSVTLCNVLVFQMVILPVLVEIAVSVPAVIEVWFAN